MDNSDLVKQLKGVADYLKVNAETIAKSDMDTILNRIVLTISLEPECEPTINVNKDTTLEEIPFWSNY